MSNETFEIGEIAVYVGPYVPWQGLQVTVLSDLQMQAGMYDIATGADVPDMEVYAIDPPTEEYETVYAEPSELRKLRPPGDDGRKVVEWSAFPWWNPTKVDA